MNQLKSLKEVWNKYNFILTVSQKRWGIVVIVMTLIGALCETLGVSVIIPLVQVMIAPQQLRQNAFIAPIIEGLNLHTDVKLIWAIGIAVILVYVFKNLFLLLLSYVRIKYACKIERELSIELMNSYMKREYIFFLNTGTGELLRNMRDGISNTYLALYQVFKLFADVITIAFVCIYIMISDVVMAICVVALAVVCLLIVVFGFQKWVKRCGEIYYKYTSEINKVLLQAFQVVKEILVMQRQEYFVESYGKNYQKRQKGAIGQTVAIEGPAYIIEAICVGGLLIAVCLKAIVANDAAELVPQLASFAIAAFRILPSLGRISGEFNQFVACMPGVNDTYKNLKLTRNIDVNFNADMQRKAIIEREHLSFADKVSVENVAWKYPDAEYNVLKHISIDIKKGQSVAFVGKSGAGKTTLADIILGLLSPQEGEVKVDGINITNLPASRSKLMGFVPQNVNLLDDTVRRNVAFGIKDEEIEDTKVWKALEQAQLRSVIEECADGLDTEIGERGIRFSGGQRQRFAIARALYNDPDILILDEATSALDTETETAVMEAIEELKGQKSLIVIAHRLTTIKNCDVIYEIVDGKAVIRTYEELIDSTKQ